MSQRWAIQLTTTAATIIGNIRHLPHVCVGVDGETVWILVTVAEHEALSAEIIALPGERFQVLDDEQIVRDRHRVPTGRLPQLSWQPIADFLRPSLPPPLLAGENAPGVTLQLVRGGSPAEATLLLTSIQAWHNYVVTAPQVRLNQLAFAMNARREVIVRGAPLPPLPGLRYVVRCGIAIPAGFTWEPDVSADVVRVAVGIVDDDVALFRDETTWDLIDGTNFVPATRSAVRASVEAAT